MKKSILLMPLILLATLLGACSSPATVPAVPAGQGATCVYKATADASKKVQLPRTTGVTNVGTTTAVLKLNDKPLGLTLDNKSAPCTANSFISLASQKYFDGTSCHRLADSGIFVLQCGDPTGTGTRGPGYEFADELTGKETYPAGTLAMANAGAGTNGSQFFIVFEDTQLSPNYTVFGVIDAAGLKVVKAIAAGGQDGTWGDGTGKPKLPAVITSVTVG